MDSKQIRKINLQRLIAQAGGQGALSRLVGSSPSYISQIISPNINKLVGDQLARRLEVAFKKAHGWMDVLHDDEESSTEATEQKLISNVVGKPRPLAIWNEESELGEGYVFIPRLTLKASCGRGKAVWEIEEKGQRQAFRSVWTQSLGIDPGQSATIVAEGDSMEPRIRDGDSLVVDYKSTSISSGKVYLIAMDGEFMVKRLFREPGGRVRIVSDNPSYPSSIIQPEDESSLQIVAKVVALCGGMA